MTQGWKTILTLTGCCHSSTFFSSLSSERKTKIWQWIQHKSIVLFRWFGTLLNLKLPQIAGIFTCNSGFFVFNCGYFYLRLRVFSLRLRVFCLRLRVFCLRLRVFLPAIAGTFACVCKYFHLQLLVFLLQIECIIACKSWQFCMPVAGKFALVPMYNYL